MQKAVACIRANFPKAFRHNNPADRGGDAAAFYFYHPFRDYGLLYIHASGIILQHPGFNSVFRTQHLLRNVPLPHMAAMGERISPNFGQRIVNAHVLQLLAPEKGVLPHRFHSLRQLQGAKAGGRKRVRPDFFQPPAKFCLGQPGTVRKSLVADFLNPREKAGPFQTPAGKKRFRSNPLDVPGQLHLLQRGAVAKRLLANALEPGSKPDPLQSRTAGKASVANTLQAVGQKDFFQSPAVFKCVFFNFQQALRESDFLQMLVVGEAMLLNALDG